MGARSMPADALIVHQSAHEKTWASPMVAVKGFAKVIERRYFRGGRTTRQARARLG